MNENENKNLLIRVRKKEKNLIERIEVHNNDKSSDHWYVKVDIFFTAVGMIDTILLL